MRFPAEPVRLADLTNNRDCLHENNARVHKMPRARIYVNEEMKLCLFVYRKTFPRPKRAGRKYFVMDVERATSQDIRPRAFLVLNLMPTKIVTETQLARLLGNTTAAD